MAVPVLPEKNQIIDNASDFLFFAAIALTVWGIVSPETVLVFTKRRTRLWAAFIGVCLALFFIGIGLYAEKGEMDVETIFGVLTVGLIIRSSRLSPLPPKLKPATNYVAAKFATQGQAGGQGPAPAAPPPPAANNALADAQAQVAQIRAGVPEAQQPIFDQLYNSHMSKWSLFGTGQVAKNNLTLAQKCVGEANRIWTLKNGDLPSIEVSLTLDAGETCVWKGQATRQAYVRIQHQEVQRNSDGSSTVRNTNDDELQDVDDGKLYLTTKRLIYAGEKETLQFGFHDILSLEIEDYDTIKIAVPHGANVLLQAEDIRDPFDKHLQGPFEILWNRVRK
jgi:hypothetical protein